MKKTYSQKTAEVSRTWYHVDAAGIPVGRLATTVAQLLLGKAKTTYTPHVDGGDYVIVTNASGVSLSGRKAEEFVYHYSGYPGGLRQTSHAQVMATNPAKLVKLAIAGMVPTNKLKRARMARLKIYASAEHEHMPQQPKTIEVKL